MFLKDLFENDHDHARALHTTGFWGNQGAGCIFFAKNTGKFLLAHRSDAVEQPDTWGVWGGAIDSGENPAEAAKREAYEEAGHDGEIEMLPMFVFSAVKNGKVVFKYYNFLAVVDHEFTPVLNWETQGFKWCMFGQWPTPLHFGVQALLKDAKSNKIMKELASRFKQQ